MIESKQVGPFMGVRDDFQRQYGKRHLRIVSYQAYNAMGLIGPEQNGVAILDEDRRCVITDRLGQEDSGYFGVSRAQSVLAERLRDLPDDDFATYVRKSAYLREPFDV